MFDEELITRLVELMVDKDLREIDLQDGDNKICVKRGVCGEVIQTVPVAGAAGLGSAPGSPVAGAAPPATPTETDSDEGLVPIVSPMVGTFYVASDPESPPFVNIGSRVGPDTAVCIIEAMKVFNEIKAETSGTIERIMVQNEQPVEFGQTLFMVRPS